jgi:hypothetical protein
MTEQELAMVLLMLEYETSLDVTFQWAALSPFVNV